MTEANVIGSAIARRRRADAPALTVPRFEVQSLKDRAVRSCGPRFACCSRPLPSSC